MKEPVTDVSLLPPPTQPIPTFVDGFTRKREPVTLDNPFTPDKVRSQISLSVYNRPASMARLRPSTAVTQDALIRKMPGYKPPAAPKGEDGEEIPQAQLGGISAREPILPDFKVSQSFDFISKNAINNARQQQLEEIHSIRDYLAKPHVKRDEKDKTYINIPAMKTFERAILMPSQHQDDPAKLLAKNDGKNDRKYPTYGEFLMVNPHPKKKKKKKGKKGKKR